MGDFPRNTGCQCQKTIPEYFLFTDADIDHGPNSLQNLLVAIFRLPR